MFQLHKLGSGEMAGSVSTHPASLRTGTRSPEAVCNKASVVMYSCNCGDRRFSRWPA